MESTSNDQKWKATRLKTVLLYKVRIASVYEVQIGSLYKVLNSVLKKGHHILVQEGTAKKVLNSEILNFLKVLNKKSRDLIKAPPHCKGHGLVQDWPVYKVFNL